MSNLQEAEVSSDSLENDTDSLETLTKENEFLKLIMNSALKQINEILKTSQPVGGIFKSKKNISVPKMDLGVIQNSFETTLNPKK